MRIHSLTVYRRWARKLVPAPSDVTGWARVHCPDAIQERMNTMMQPWPKRTLALAALFVSLSVGAVPGLSLAQEATGGQPALFRSLLSTVVNISARSQVTAPSNSPSVAASAVGRVSTMFGSGFLIDASGVIATNWHVVNGASEVTVTFSDGSHSPATLLAASRLMDVALIKVDPAGRVLPVVRWGNSDTVQIGEPVVAIGNPLGIGTSVSTGIVSALNRDISESPYDDFIQTDAAINHGNSGGPLFNMRGEVIGINAAIVSPTTASAGLGFAIPAHDARFVIDRLRKYGSLRPGWIGLKVQQITPDLAQALSFHGSQGVLVSDMAPGGPAMTSGIAVGDVVLAVNDHPISDERAFLREIVQANAGTPLRLRIRHDAVEQVLTITVGDWPTARWDALDAPVQAAALRWVVPPDLGLGLAELTPESRAQFGLPVGQDGVLVTGVAAGTDAATRGLVPGDVVLRVGVAPVRSADALRAEIAAVRAEKSEFVPLLVLPRAEQWPGPHWVALRVATQ